MKQFFKGYVTLQHYLSFKSWQSTGKTIADSGFDRIDIFLTFYGIIRNADYADI